MQLEIVHHNAYVLRGSMYTSHWYFWPDDDWRVQSKRQTFSDVKLV